MPEYSTPRRAAENSRAFSAASITAVPATLFAECAAEAGEDVVNGIVRVFEEADAFVALDHRRAALGECGAIEADHRDPVAIARSGNLVANARRRRRDLGDQNVGFFDPARQSGVE